MTDKDRESLVGYRLQQAEGALRQARLLADAGEWDGVVNRAYYAMFYVALALLLTRDLGASKHTGVLALVDREFVRRGVFPAEMSRRLRDAFNERQKFDYREFAPPPADKARTILDSAVEFVTAVKAATPQLLMQG